MRIIPALLSLSVLGCSLLHPQTITVTPASVVMRQAQGGPLASGKKISISTVGAPVEWTAAATTDDGEPWIYLDAPNGKTPASIFIGIVNYRGEIQKPGHYTGAVKITADGQSQIVKVDWTVVGGATDPKFTYLAGPAGCQQPSGYLDAALCTPLDESPIGQFKPPAPGVTYVDPNFGAKIRVMTGPGIHHTYSTPNPLSANNKYLMTFPVDGTFDVVDAATGKPAFRKVDCNQNFFWDADNDDVYYTLEGAAVIRYDLKRKKRTKVVDYGKAPHKFEAITRGGTGDSSKDNWISFFAPKEQQVCALDINNAKTYCSDYGHAPGPAFNKIDYSLVSKGIDKISGKRYVVLVAAGSTPGIYSVNPVSGKLEFETRGPEEPESVGNHDKICDPGEKCMYPSHSDTLEDSAGIQYLVYNKQTETPCEVSVSTYQLNKGIDLLEPAVLGGGRKKIFTLWKCPFPNTPVPDEHVGCAKKAPYCVISTVPPLRSAADPPVRFAHTTEIILFRDNGTEVRRLAQHRSAPLREEGDESYWSQPHAALSNDASLVVFDSNFGVAKAQRINILETGTK